MQSAELQNFRKCTKWLTMTTNQGLSLDHREVLMNKSQVSQTQRFWYILQFLLKKAIIRKYWELNLNHFISSRNLLGAKENVRLRFHGYLT